jgi:hypothetical protein
MSDEINADDLQSLFPTPEERAADARLRAAFGPGPGRDNQRSASYEQSRENDRLFGGMVTRRMREAAERRAEAARNAIAPSEVAVAPQRPRPEFLIDWFQSDTWSTPQGVYRIHDMVDQHLWQTVIWCVRNVESLYQMYDQVPLEAVLALSARRWLRQQTAFRALLQESLRRSLTFPPDVCDYIKRYLLNKADELVSYEPWNDPAVKAEQLELQEFLLKPTVVNQEEDYGKEARAIDL